MQPTPAAHAAELDGELTAVRSTPLSEPATTAHSGDPTMPDSLQLSAVDYLAHDRINDLYAAATETRSPLRRSSAERAGLIAPTPGGPRRGALTPPARGARAT